MVEKLQAEVKFKDDRIVTATVPLKPGSFITLKGKQGLGKTTLLRAIAWVLGTDMGNIPDGSMVTFNEDLVVTNHRKSKASLETPLIDSETLWKLVDSGAKNKKTRASHRVKALLSLVTVTEEDSVKILSDLLDKDLAGKVMSQPPLARLGLRWKVSYREFIDRVKRSVETIARNVESESERHQGMVLHCITMFKDMNLLEGVERYTPNIIEKVVLDLEKRLPEVPENEKARPYVLNNLDYYNKKAIKLEVSIEEKREIADQLKDLDDSEQVSQEDIDHQKKAVITLKDKCARIQKRIDEAKNSLHEYEKELVEAKAEGKRLVSIKKMQDGIEKKRQEVADIEEEEKELDSFRKGIERCRAQLEVLAVYSAAKECYDDLMASHKEKKELAKKAKKLRAIEFLKADLNALGFKKSKIIDDDVAIIVNGEWRKMDELSEGEKVKAAFDLLTTCDIENKTAFVDRRLFSALQPKNKKLVIKEIIERKLIGLTEEPTDSEEMLVEVHS